MIIYYILYIYRFCICSDGHKIRTTYEDVECRKQGCKATMEISMHGDIRLRIWDMMQLVLQMRKLD